MSNFKDRLMEKYAVLADEYTDQFKKLEFKNLNMTEQITKLQRMQD